MNDVRDCPDCGEEIKSQAKKCKHCHSMIDGASQVIASTSKKPFWKKWWVWGIAIVLCISMINSCGGSDNQSSNVSINNKTETTTLEEVVQVAVESGTLGEQNATASAKSYLNFTAFSYEGLINQLEFEGYTRAEAEYGIQQLEVDWNEQAVKSAKNYLKFAAFSYSGLINQLEFEQFTNEQATYGVDNCEADWKEQAGKSAKNYLEFSSFSRSELINQLEFEGFTSEEAEYGVTIVGY